VRFLEDGVLSEPEVREELGSEQKGLGFSLCAAPLMSLAQDSRDGLEMIRRTRLECWRYIKTYHEDQSFTKRRCEEYLS
jgi:hypothetical protein